MTSTSEEWRSVVGFEGHYEVSSEGRVRSVDRTLIHGSGHPWTLKGRALKPAVNRGGYPIVVLCVNGSRHTAGVHTLAALAFLGPRPAGLDICHYDDVKTNNRTANLRYDTRSANQLDRVRLGTHNLAGRTHCKHGHEFTPENTGQTSTGCRRCRACDSAAERQRRAAMKAS